MNTLYMRQPRIFQPCSLKLHQTIELDADGSNHVARVLRMQREQEIILFNGDGSHFICTITDVTKKKVCVTTLSKHDPENESPLHLHLGQVISRGDRMDFTLQKSVELGVHIITPLFSERCGVKMSQERLEKKIQQWQKIVISACEQSGRNKIPQVRPTMQLQDWCAEDDEALKLTLHPRAEHGINQLQGHPEKIRLLIGSEGGLSSEEIETTKNQGFKEILLGPRVLRTETAALTTISALQLRFGDLG